MPGNKIVHRLIKKLEWNNKIIEKSGDARIYKDALLLTPGSWTDAITKSPVEYSIEELDRAANIWTTNFLDIDHSWGTLDRIGYVKNPYSLKGKIYADLHIYPVTQRAKDTIALIDSGLINQLSVELASEDKWDGVNQKRLATNIEFLGCAIVCFGACHESRIVK